jgi:DnaJ family protein C protein 28
MLEPQKARDWASSVEEQIREAISRGAFSNLPGQGKPLDLTPNPYAQDWELAFKILKDAGCAPEWIELDRRIRAKQEESRDRLATSWKKRRGFLDALSSETGATASTKREQVEQDWRMAVECFRQDVAAINAEIAELNLKVPSPRFQRYMIEVDQVLADFEGSPE